MADEWLEGVGEGASSWPTLDFAVTGDTQPGIQMVDGRNRAQKLKPDVGLQYVTSYLEEA